jgi:prepilin-type N-terminal cleavage/methylation domain-containing protein
MKNPNKPAAGFSLTELLVSLLIITVLAAVTLAVVSRMRQSANQSITTANLRQIGVALVTFASDKGRFPNRTGEPVWDRSIIANLGFTDPLPGNGSIKKTAYPQLEASARLFFTPEDKAVRDESVYPRSFAIVPWTTNWSDGTAFRGWKDRPYNVGVPYSSLTAPEKSVMVVQWFSGNESIPNYFGHGNHAYHDRGGPLEAIGDFQQALFADGHIEKIRGNMGNPEFVAKYWPGTLGQVK